MKSPKFSDSGRANANNRISLRMPATDKAVIMRAAAVAQKDMTDFILRVALREARSVIEENERLSLTSRDSLLAQESARAQRETTKSRACPDGMFLSITG